MRLTDQEREEVVDLLRAAADLSLRNQDSLSLYTAAVMLDVSGRVRVLAVCAEDRVCGQDRPWSLLEAARRVEEDVR